MKSYGRAPTLLALTGYEQVRSVVAELVGDHEGARKVELVLPETGAGVAGPADPNARVGRPGTDGGVAELDWRMRPQVLPITPDDEHAKVFRHRGCHPSPAKIGGGHQPGINRRRRLLPTVRWLRTLQTS